MNMIILDILPLPQHILELVTEYPGDDAIEVLFLLLFVPVFLNGFFFLFFRVGKSKCLGLNWVLMSLYEGVPILIHASEVNRHS